MAKRANGEGTLRKRSDGRWEGRYIEPVTEEWKSIYGKTQKEVRQKLMEIAQLKDISKYIGKSDVTVSEYYMYYINTFKRDAIRPQNFPQNYIAKYNAQISPYWKDKPLQSVTSKKQKPPRLVKIEGLGKGI